MLTFIRYIMVFAVLIGCLLQSLPLQAEGLRLTIIHTNDLHSHVLGFAPNIQYRPNQINADITRGGWARIASLIKKIRTQRDNPVLAVDAGDFMMGSLFHLLAREEAFELRLMKAMGYEIVTLGNHEFDLMPDGLARILTTAENHGALPEVVSSNVVFSSKSDKDDTLEETFKRGLVKPYTILERGGLKIGVFGLMGRDAAEVAPFASPVKFGDPVETAKKITATLKNDEKVDLVICLSHSGLSDNPQHSEDEILAREVGGIDVIISGHTHTKTDGAKTVNGVIIVQAWVYGKQAGVLDLEIENGKARIAEYRLVDIDAGILGDPEITAMADNFQEIIDEKVLKPKNMSFKGIIAHTNFDLTIKPEETNLGDLIADSIRWYINHTEKEASTEGRPVDLAFISNGVIRDPVLRGQTGDLALCDIFRSIPLGVGMDGTMGYPLVSFYIYPEEVKKALEIMPNLYPLKGSDYYVQISGAKFTYNPNRMLFDRVTDVWLGDEETGWTALDYSGDDKTLIRVAADIYNSTFLKIIGRYTWQFLNIIPKDADGNPIEDLKTVRVDADPNQPGIQELKEWVGVVEYIRTQADITGNGVSDIPPKYAAPQGRIIVEASWNPYHLVKRPGKSTYLALVVLALILTIIAVGAIIIKKRLRRK